MSKRAQEIIARFAEIVAGAAIDIVEWGGVAVAPAAAKSDAQSNDSVVPEIGSRGQAFNGATWDRVRAGLSAATSTITGYVNDHPFRKYNLVAPVLVDGQFVGMQCNASGYDRSAEQYAPVAEDNTVGVYYVVPRATSSATGAWTLSSVSVAMGTAGVGIKATAGRVKRIRVTNTNAATGFYLAIVNKASAPVNGDAIVERVWVPPRDPNPDVVNSSELWFGDGGMALTTGIAFAISTTAGTVTLPGTSDCLYSIEWL